MVGLEVHARLETTHKLFTPVPSRFAPEAPNRHVSPYCLGLPGVLPRLNEDAVHCAARVALALGCTVHRESRFARKHYVYPDLPKGYQITQADQPLATDGQLSLPLTGPGPARVIRVARVHLEEDAAKTVELENGRTGIDFNRAGVPLVEIVTHPDLRSGAEAAAALRELRAILLALGASDGSPERGSLRCDANVSVRRRGDAALGVRCEVKNVSGFRYVARAIEVEAERQRGLQASGRAVAPETRGFDAPRGTTYRLRSKEAAPDYRFMPDPDLPALRLEAAAIEDLRRGLPELPAARRARWRAAGLPAEPAVAFAADPELADAFDAAAARRPEHILTVGNLFKTEVLRRVGEDRAALARLDAGAMAELIDLEAEGRISKTQQKTMLDALLTGAAASVTAALAQAGGEAVRDRDQLMRWVDDALRDHAEEAQIYRSGKTKVLGRLVGEVMKRSGGRADPKLVKALLLARLE